MEKKLQVLAGQVAGTLLRKYRIRPQAMGFDKEDLVGEIFLTVWEKSKKVSPDFSANQARNYLWETGIGAGTDFLRRNSRWQYFRNRKFAKGKTVYVDRKEDVEEYYRVVLPEQQQHKWKKSLRWMDVLALLANYPEDAKKLRLYAEGYSLKEIGQMYNRTEAWACSQLKTIVRELHRIVREEYGASGG